MTDRQLPKVHPRTKLVRKAEREVLLALTKATRVLTTAEILKVVTNVLINEIGGIAKYAIRQERHGDTDQPGDTE